MPVQLDRFYRFTTPDLPGVSDPMVDQALVSAAVEFCTRSGVSDAWVDAFQTVDGESSYGLDLPQGMLIQAIVSAQIGNRNLDPVSFDTLVAAHPDWKTKRGAPAACYLDDATQEIVLVPTPDRIEGVEVRCRYVPTFAAKALPDILFNRYAPGISAGAKAILQRMPSQPWSNPQAAQANMFVFDMAINTAAAHKAKQGTRMPLRTTFV